MAVGIMNMNTGEYCQVPGWVWDLWIQKDTELQSLRIQLKDQEEAKGNEVAPHAHAEILNRVAIAEWEIEKLHRRLKLLQVHLKAHVGEFATED